MPALLRRRPEPMPAPGRAVPARGPDRGAPGRVGNGRMRRARPARLDHEPGHVRSGRGGDRGQVAGPPWWGRYPRRQPHPRTPTAGA